MTNLKTWEDDKYHYASYMPEYIPSDDLGRGSSETIIRFLTNLIPSKNNCLFFAKLNLCANLLMLLAII